MNDREIVSGVPLLLIYLVLCCACAAILLGGCAHKQMQHSEMWKVCAEHCGETGGLDPTVVEDTDHRGCICTKPKDAT